MGALEHQVCSLPLWFCSCGPEGPAAVAHLDGSPSRLSLLLLLSSSTAAAASAATTTAPATLQPTMSPTGAPAPSSSTPPPAAAPMAPGGNGGAACPRRHCATGAGSGASGRTASSAALTPHPRYASSVKPSPPASPSCSSATPADSSAACRSTSPSMQRRKKPPKLDPSVASVNSARKSSAGSANVTLCSSMSAVVLPCALAVLAVTGAASAESGRAETSCTPVALLKTPGSGSASTCSACTWGTPSATWIVVGVRVSGVAVRCCSAAAR